jgi:CubicO group peptidase (beta-lactamase class C family)
VSEFWLAAASALAARPEFGVHSLLVANGDVLVFEEYYNGWDPDQPHPLFSVTKSITSLLVGIAVRDGYIPGEHVPVTRWFPGARAPGWDPAKDSIELAHLLSNTSGLEWREWEISYTDPGNSQYRMANSKDWAEFVLDQPLTGEPGQGFEYNTGGFFLLGRVLERATGMTVDRLADRELFGPLGIGRFEWARNGQGEFCTGGSLGGLRLTSRDLARVGLMVMDGGRWQGRRVVPQDWLERSTARHAGLDNCVGYGYGWWVYDLPGLRRRVRMTVAQGYGGQALMLFPDQQVLAVMTCDHRDPDMRRLVPVLACLMTAVVGFDAIPAGAQLSSSMGG